jgi:hypothetical protein
LGSEICVDQSTNSLWSEHRSCGGSTVIPSGRQLKRNLAKRIVRYGCGQVETFHAAMGSDFINHVHTELGR